jgi:hypothetical protein
MDLAVGAGLILAGVVVFEVSHVQLSRVAIP